MELKKEKIDSGDLIQGFEDIITGQSGFDEIESCWQWPDEIGSGFMHSIKLRPGLLLTICSYVLKENIAISCAFTEMPLVLCYSLAGGMRYTNNGAGQINGIDFNKGFGTVTYMPEWQGVAEYKAGCSMQGVCIYIDPNLLGSFLDSKHDHIPASLCNIISGDQNSQFYQASATTPQTNIALRQIVDCPYQGSLRRLYLESKTLELITQGIMQVASSQVPASPASPGPASPSLLSDDIERIREAKEIIVRNLENPPSLLELARRVGINKNKLSRGFQQVYGTSVFSYLRIQRLELARDLLECKKMNVTEAALKVGYAQQSNFSKAFIRHFGTSPKDLLR